MNLNKLFYTVSITISLIAGALIGFLFGGGWYDILVGAGVAAFLGVGGIFISRIIIDIVHK